MRNFFKSNKEENLEKIDVYKIYIPSYFDLIELKNYIEVSLEESQKKEYRTILEDCELLIDVDITTDVKKGITNYRTYKIIPKEDILEIHCQKIVDSLEETKKSKTDIDLFKTKDKLVERILSFSTKLLEDNFFIRHQENKMEYITSLSTFEKNGLFANLKDKEICLACLGITNLESKLFEVNKKADYYFVITSKRNLVLSSETKKVLVEDVTGNHLEIKEKIGKDNIKSEQFSFDTELFNDTLFVYLKELLNLPSDKRIEHYTDLIFNKYNSKIPHLQYLEKLYNYQVLEKDKLKRTLKSQLVFQFIKKQCVEELKVQDSFLELLYSETNFGNTLYQIMQDWNITPIEQYQFLELITENNDNFKLKNLDAFYDSVIAGMVNQKKTPKNKLEYHVKHLAYLKDTQQYEKAVPFYEYVLENLKDDSLLELISDTKTNVLDGEDCNLLRIKLLDELSEIKQKLKESNVNELLELAQLQPLVLDRLTQLALVDNQSVKVTNILALFKKEAFNDILENASKESIEKDYDKDELFDIVVPDCFKESKNFLEFFTNLIAQSNPPDYKQVITYSEQLSSSNYPEVYSVLEELIFQLKLEKIECYIGNGDFSKSIIGVEGAPDFLIIGKDFLNPDNIYYLTRNELKFNLATELTHVLFKHTRITSKDVWRGAKSKGMDLAGVLLIALPALSTVGNFAGKFIDISKYSKVFTSVDKVNNLVDKGQSALEYGGKITESFSNNEKESELLATSRLMEISADRVGLLLTNDIKSAITVLLKNNDNYEIAIKAINRDGLYSYLLQQNNKGEFIYQELIIRIKTLFSFYLREN